MVGEERWQGDPASPRNCQPPRLAHPPFHSHPPEGPTRICAYMVTSTREHCWRALSAPRPLRGGGGRIFREECPEGQAREHPKAGAAP